MFIQVIDARSRDEASWAKFPETGARSDGGAHQARWFPGEDWVRYG